MRLLLLWSNVLGIWFSLSLFYRHNSTVGRALMQIPFVAKEKLKLYIKILGRNTAIWFSENDEFYQPIKDS